MNTMVDSNSQRSRPQAARSLTLGGDFEGALVAEIVASEAIRVRVLAATLAVVLALDLLALAAAPDVVERLARQPVAWYLPLFVFGPFLAYEIVVAFVLTYRRDRGLGMPVAARFANAAVETSLPTVILWVINAHTGPEFAFGSWPSLLYFVFITAATLRLDFVLPLFTGAVAAISYLAVAYAVLPLSNTAADPLLVPVYHLSKALIMLLAGVVAGLVALRLRGKFARAFEALAARERITNLFGQHVSPEVVEQLLAQPAELGGEIREICVMFLDIRDFTAHSRSRRPDEVVEFLNDAFAFMIEAVDRHHGIINKFLGDGFMAVFGAPLPDGNAAHNAVAAARDILAEIDRQGLATREWPLRIGIGLHYGKAVTGNIGSPRRKEFTAIGDTVNLAARIEQLTKEFGARLLVSRAVMTALGPDSGATALPAAAIKGYSEKLEVWRLD
jgi:adenylate cyclase